MDISVWGEKETKLCVSKIPDWRTKTFREQEEFITKLKWEHQLTQSNEEIRFRFNYLDQLTNNEFSSYQLFTIPATDKKYIGLCPK